MAQSHAPVRAPEFPEGMQWLNTDRPLRLADLRGKVVLLNFWATWCVPCRREMPMLSSVHRQHADEGLVVLYVSLEELLERTKGDPR